MCRGSVDDLSAYRTQIRIQRWFYLTTWLNCTRRLSISYLLPPFYPLPRHAQVYPLFDVLRPWFMTASQSNCMGLHWAQHQGFPLHPLITRCDDDHDWSHEITRWVLPVRGCNKIVWPRHAQVYPLLNFLRSWFMTASQPVRWLALSTAWLKDYLSIKNQRRWRLRLIPRDRKMGTAYAGGNKIGWPLLYHKVKIYPSTEEKKLHV